MKVVLELQDQPSNIKRVTVCHDIVIGRGSECNLRLSAPQVSRRHCFLRVGASAASITDLESSNGTFVDGQKIPAGKKIVLKDGMKIAVGPIQFVARVRSEVIATDLPTSGHVDDSVVTSADEIVAEALPPNGRNIPTVADVAGDMIADEMNFSVEHAGESVEADEPTADYPSSDGLLPRQQQTVYPDEVLDSQSEIVDLGKEAGSDEVDPDANDVVEVDVVEVIDVVADDEDTVLSESPVVEDVVEVIEDEFDDDVVEVIDDDFDVVEVVDDDDFVEVIEDEEPSSASWFDVEDDAPPASKSKDAKDVDGELDDFLKGLN